MSLVTHTHTLSLYLSLIGRCGEAIPKYAGDFIGAFVRVVATRPPCNGSEEV